MRDKGVEKSLACAQGPPHKEQKPKTEKMLEEDKHGRAILSFVPDLEMSEL